MKVLLVGDNSGIHFNLYQTLLQQGHQVLLLSNGDGYKKIGLSNKITFLQKRLRIIYFILRELRKMLLILRLDNDYDIIQFCSINGGYIDDRLGLKNIERRVLFNKARSSSFWVSGFNPIVAKNWEAELRSSFPNFDELELNLHFFSAESFFSFSRELEKFTTIISSTSGLYMQRFADLENWNSVIGFPILRNEVRKLEKKVSESKKVVITHGITRPNLKGTSFFLDIMQKLETRHPDRVEIKIIKQASYADFLDTLQSTDIYLDQICGDSLGVATLTAMKYGAVPVTAFQQERYQCAVPAVNTRQNVDDLVATLSNLIEDPSSLAKMKLAAIDYVEENHNAEKIAVNFINAWSQVSMS